MKKLAYGLIAIVVAGLVAFFTVVPWYVDRSHNALHAGEPHQSSISAQSLHTRLRISDLHADSLLWDRDLLKENTWGHVDIPRLIKGNIALQAFSVVTKTPRRQHRTQQRDDGQYPAAEHRTTLAAAHLDKSERTRRLSGAKAT